MRRNFLFLVLAILVGIAVFQKAQKVSRVSVANKKTCFKPLQDDYRLTPDNRFLLAIQDIHALITGEPRETVHYTFKEKKWHISYKDIEVGTFPEFPRFKDALQLLSNWTKKLANEYDFKVSSKRQAYPVIKKNIDSFLSVNLFTALKDIDEIIRKKGWNVTLLEYSTHAFTQLCLMSFTDAGIGDQIMSRALAILCLNRMYGKENMQNDECLLAHLMGYENYAYELSDSLSMDNPIRLYLHKKDTELYQLIIKHSTPQFIRYLYLIRSQNEGRNSEWGDLVELYFQGKENLLPVAKSGVNLSFHIVSYIIPFLQGGVILEAEQNPFFTPHEKRDTDIKMHFIDLFESNVQNINVPKKYRLLDTGFIRNYYRSYFYSGLYAIGRYYYHQLSDVDATLNFAKEINSATSPKADFFKHWYQNLAESLAGKANFLKTKRVLLDPYSPLGIKPLHYTFDELKKYTSWNFRPNFIATVKQFLGRLDTRPSHLYFAWIVAHDDLNDMVLVERFLTAYVNCMQRRAPLAIAHYYHYSRESDNLEAMLHWPDMTVETATTILLYLSEYDTISHEKICQWYESWINRFPDNYPLTEHYTDYLIDKEDYSRAEKWARQILDRKASTWGLEGVIMRGNLAWSLYKQKKYQEALKEVNKVQNRQVAYIYHIKTWILERMGDTAGAEKWAQKGMKRFPFSIHALARLCEILWRHDKYKDAALQIQAFPNPLSIDDWKSHLGENFARTFKDKTTEQTLQAAYELLNKKRNEPYLSSRLEQITINLYKEKLYEAAFKYQSQIRDASPLTDLAQRQYAYACLLKWQGKEKALAWLKEHISAKHKDAVVMPMLDEPETTELIWDFLPHDYHGPNPEYVWLCRALIYIQGKDSDPDHYQMMNTYFNRTDVSQYYHRIGQYLLGKIDKNELLKITVGKKKRCEIFYFIGAKAKAEGRHYDASNWFRASVETGYRLMGEYRWATMELNAYMAGNKFLRLWNKPTNNEKPQTSN